MTPQSVGNNIDVSWTEWWELKCTMVLKDGSTSSRPPITYWLLCPSCWAVTVPLEPASSSTAYWPFTSLHSGRTAPPHDLADIALQSWASLQNPKFHSFVDIKLHKVFERAREMWQVWFLSLLAHISMRTPNPLLLHLFAHDPTSTKLPHSEQK